MKTSPAFQFYPSDFLSGTAHMTAAEVGAYIRLLCHQWQQGYIPSESNKLTRISGVSFTKLGEVMSKFETGEDGNLRNARLESVREKLQSYREKQAEHGKKGGRPPIGKPKGEERPPLTGEKGSLTSQSQSQSQSQEGIQPASQRQIPTLAQAIAFASEISVTAEEAEAWWHAREASQWTRSSNGTTQKIGSIKSDCKSYVNHMRERKLTKAANRPGLANAEARRAREIETVHTAATLPRL